MEDAYTSFHRVLSVVGISIFANENWNSKTWFILQTFNFFVGTLCFFFTTGFVIDNVSNLLLFIQGACVWTTGVIMTLSLGVCLYFRNDFREFLNEMAFKDKVLEIPLIKYVLYQDNLSGENLMQLKELVTGTQKNTLKYIKFLLKLYVMSVWLCVTLYMSTPIYLMIIRNDQSERLLAFDMWFPWSLENFAVYIASFTFHAYCGYLCCIAYPGLQSTIILLLAQVIRQLKILTFILLHLNELGYEITGNDPKRWQTCCTAILTQCIDHYVKIKRFSNKLNIICRPFYLTLILVAIMLVCMCSVKIAISNKLSPDTMKYYVHEFCFILVVLMFCMVGQQVENECELLENAVTEKWYIYDRSHKKNVLIFNMALSQRMPIYIFGTITLSLPTFTWFLKTGMSFFTLVMSVLDEEH